MAGGVDHPSSIKRVVTPARPAVLGQPTAGPDRPRTSHQAHSSYRSCQRHILLQPRRASAHRVCHRRWRHWSRRQPDGGLKPGYLPEPIPFLRILAVSDHEDVRGEHKPLT
jgi:hypothetical protein